MANERIVDLNVETSPNNFSTLVGVKDGEVVQIPITSLKHLVGNNLNTLSFYIENAETTPLSVITEAIIDAGYQDKGTCVPVQLNGDWNCFWLCGVYATATAGVYGFIAIDLSDSTMYGLEVDPTEMMLYNFTDHILTEYATKEWVASIRDSLNTRIDNLQNSGGSSGGSSLPSGGGGIITVTELPTENIDASALYRIEEIDTAKSVNYSTETTDDGETYTFYIDENIYVYVVDELPEVGEPFIDMTTGKQIMYLTQVGQGHLYITEETAPIFGMDEFTGWLKSEDVGVTVVLITSLDEATSIDPLYILITKQYRLYYYDGSKFVKLSKKNDFTDRERARVAQGGGSSSSSALTSVPVATDTTVGGLKYAFDTSTSILTLIFDE